MSRIRHIAACSAFVFLTTAPSNAIPVVHPGDTLGIDVLNYAAVIDDSGGRLKGLNAESVVVAADGSISIPVVGTLNVGGKSTRQIGRVIESRLSGYVRDPSVTVRLLQQSQLIFLTGATIGTLPFLPGETLSSALGQLHEQLEKDVAQVLTPSDKYGGALSRSPIDLRNIAIERDAHVGPAIDGEDLLRSGMPGPALVPGDTLRLASKPVRVDVRGEVAAPGPIYLYKTDTLEQAVLAAGGALPSASTADASLLRDGKELPIPLGGAALRQVPQNGDAIVVRAAPHVTVLGQVPTPGEFTLKNGTTLLSALYIAGGPTKWANVRDIEVIHNGVRQSYDLSNLQHGDLSPNVPLVDGDVVYVPEGHKIDAAGFFQGLVGALGAAYSVTHL
jgi:protein involved in polysaccharide export with SLBB domain